MDDVIGSEPERAPRRRRAVRGVRLPDRLRRHRRVLAALAVALAVVGVVAALRAGMTGLKPEHGPGAPVAGAQRKPPLAGTVLTLASGQNSVYALASDCAAGCRPMLLASGNDGVTWSTLRLPGLPSDPSAVADWRLTVTGVEDSLAIETGGNTITVGGADIPFVVRPITSRSAWPRVPAGREAMVRICTAPRCRTPQLEYLEPRTGERGLLQVQPPVRPRAFGVLGTQLWVAGVDPATRRFALAVSVDDAGSWSTVPLPEVATNPALTVQVFPVPERDMTWLLLGRPDRRGQLTVAGVWTVPAPDASGGPRRIRPDETLKGVTGAVGMKDGRLAVAAGGLFTVLADDGVTERMAPSDVDSTRYVLRAPQRGPHLLLIALAVRTDGVAAIATSLSGNPDDWKMRPVVL